MKRMEMVQRTAEAQTILHLEIMKALELEQYSSVTTLLEMDRFIHNLLYNLLHVKFTFEEYQAWLLVMDEIHGHIEAAPTRETNS